jgi:hypothetical protein
MKWLLNHSFYVSSKFKIIKLIAAWMQRFEIYDFVCKKACIKCKCALSGDLRYRGYQRFVQSRQIKNPPNSCFRPQLSMHHVPSNDIHM